MRIIAEETTKLFTGDLETSDFTTKCPLNLRTLLHLSTKNKHKKRETNCFSKQTLIGAGEGI